MNIGIRLHDTAPGTLRERLLSAQRQGFTCVHLAMSKAVPGFSMAEAPEKLTEELALQVRRDLAFSGQECAVLGCYLHLADRDGEAQRRTLACYRAHLKFARMIGARVVGTETDPAARTLFGEPLGESEEAMAQFIAALRPVVRWAEEEDAVIAIEPVHHHIISTPQRAQRMLEEIPSDHLQIILDAVNLISPARAEEADAIIEDALSRLGDQIRILHMKDFQKQPGSGEMRAVACGLGRMRYERLLAFGKAHDLPMTLENTAPDNAVQAREYLEKIAAGL